MFCFYQVLIVGWLVNKETNQATLYYCIVLQVTLYMAALTHWLKN